jgi:hypothetical protein
VILEGIVTTIGADTSLNVAPMGPKFEGDWSRFVLRPFRTSTTFRNLKDRGEGVLHITDDVLLIARAAIGPVPDAATRAAEVVHGRILLSSARYHEFRVIDLDDRDDRATIRVETVASGRLRDLFGLNRAKHAVIEAAILATRLDLLPIDEIRSEFARLSPLVSKTGGAAEHEAFAILNAYVEAGGGQA